MGPVGQGQHVGGGASMQQFVTADGTTLVIPEVGSGRQAKDVG